MLIPGKSHSRDTKQICGTRLSLNLDCCYKACQATAMTTSRVVAHSWHIRNRRRRRGGHKPTAATTRPRRLRGRGTREASWWWSCGEGMSTAVVNRSIAAPSGSSFNDSSVRQPGQWPLLLCGWSQDGATVIVNSDALCLLLCRRIAVHCGMWTAVRLITHMQSSDR